MEVLSFLTDGVLLALQPVNLLLILIGVTVGLFIGAMPGLGSVNGVAILLPVTFLVPPGSAIIFLAAIYYGAMYGGAISSITLGIPGASTAVATTFDGRPLALKGRASLALVTAALASFVGGTVANVFFTLFAPLLASLALSFGPPEIFALMLLAFATFVGLGGDDIPKTIFSICFGLVLATVGFDTISGEPRLVLFDIPGFLRGIGFIVLAIGVYGIGEMLWTIEQTRGEITTTNPKMTARGMAADTKEAVRRGWKGTWIGSILGFFIGVLPAAGATPGSLISYGVAKMVSRTSQDYGTGSPDGVAAPEAANNSASTGAMLPMLTLGIPGSPTTAILLGGMVIWGLTPGPRLFVDESEFVWGLIGSFYISNVAALLINLAFIPLFIWMLRMPFTILAPMMDRTKISG
ncbi:MAG: tripartite tricarboxylate transporter permease, partial [Pseudomonadota bacterium]